LRRERGEDSKRESKKKLKFQGKNRARNWDKMQRIRKGPALSEGNYSWKKAGDQQFS